MNYMKLIKLLYLADRAALLEWGRPITGDTHVSMKHGPVLSNTLNLIKERGGSVWNRLISEPTDHEVILNGDAEMGSLSQVQAELLARVFERYGHLDQWELVKLLHKLPEWKDPGKSMFPITPEDILRAENWSEEDIKEALEELDFVGQSERAFTYPVFCIEDFLKR